MRRNIFALPAVALIFALPMTSGASAQEVGDSYSLDQALEASRSATRDALAESDEMRRALDPIDLDAASVRTVDSDRQTMVVVNDIDNGRGAVLLGQARKPADAPRLSPGVYVFSFDEGGTASVTHNGAPVSFAPLPDNVGPLVAIWDSDWLCGGWPDSGGPGLNFCERFVACAQYDLFC